MKRRAFLRASLATGMLAAISNPVSRWGAESRSSNARPRIKVGFLGMVHSHASGKLRAVTESDKYELIGLCEPSNEVRARYRQPGLRWISQEPLLAQAELVLVESEVSDHARHAIAALEAGKHVHLEKAPTPSMASFRELVELARRKNKILQMGYMWRYHPGINAVLDAVRNGWLGRVYRVRATINTNIDAGQRVDLARYRGGMMFELGAHLIDPVVRMLGRPDKVTPYLKRTGVLQDGLADNTLAVFEYADAMALVSSATPQPGAGAYRSFEVLGTNGTALVNPIEPPRLRIELAKASGPYAAGRSDVPMPAYSRYAPELADLADAIQTERPLAFTPDTDLLVHETLMRACEM